MEKLLKFFTGIDLRIVGAVAALAILAGAWWYVKSSEEKDDRRNQEIGQTIERERSLDQTVERTQEANETRRELEEEVERGSSGDTRVYDLCVRYNRGPASDCDRYLVSQ